MRRRIDNLGRLVIAAEMRNEIGLENGSEVDMELKGNKIILTNPKGMKSREEIENKLDKVVNQNYKTEDTEILGYIKALEWVLNED